MFQSFRLSMAWLHTWFGLVLGFVLIVVFFFGSLSVFDREIDRWALPESRFPAQPMPSYDKVLAPVFAAIEPDPLELDLARARVDGPLPARLQVLDWGAYTTHRDPLLLMWTSFGLPDGKDPSVHVHGTVTLDPRSGETLPPGELKIGSEFFYPMHYSLHLHWLDLGYWIVGLAAMVMLAALVSGVVIHRKLFRELFTFRPSKPSQRSVLDLHNLTGVVALPFHFMFALSGLIVFASIYFPVSQTQLEPLAQAQELIHASRTGLPHEPSGVPAGIASVDAMVVEAQQRWAARGMAGTVGLLTVTHIGDRNGYVSIYRAGTDRVALTGEGVHFRAATGEVIREDPPETAIAGVHEFITGLHLQHFRHWLLRWLYFCGGMAGCVCIATGFLYFVEKRKRRHARDGVAGSRCVDALEVTAVTGTVVATLAILIGNRLLPADLANRGSWEETIFWCAWLLAFLHAAARTAARRDAQRSPAWLEQCLVIAILAALAVVLNWVTTGDHLLATLQRSYWPVAGVDLVLIATAAIAGGVAWRLRRVGCIADGPAVAQDVPVPGSINA